MKTAEIYIAGDHTRIDQIEYFERSFLTSFEFDESQCDFYEDIHLHSHDLPRTGWQKWSKNEWRIYRDGRLIYVADIV